MTQRETETYLRLTDDELLLLDGRCRPSTQDKVDEAKKRSENSTKLGLPSGQVAYFTAVLFQAEKEGKIDPRRDSSYHCQGCGSEARYQKASRSGRQGGRYLKKGDPITSKPKIMVEGVRCAGQFLCYSCHEAVKPQIADEVVKMKVEYPTWFIGTECPWERYDNITCECGWSGHKGELKPLPTLTGYGSYPGQCPSCDFKAVLFGKDFEKRAGFVVSEKWNSRSRVNPT